MLKLDIYNKTKVPMKEKILNDLVGQAEAALIKEKKIKKSDRYLVEVAFVSNKTITELNELHHHKKRTTDVISLSYFETGIKSPRSGKYEFAGEIFISLPYARMQAKQIGQSLEEELRFLFVHGLLHVFGYDHMLPKEEAHMLKLTYGILGR